MKFLDAVLSQNEETPDKEIIYLRTTPISGDKADFFLRLLCEPVAWQAVTEETNQ